MDKLLALISEWHHNLKITVNGNSSTQTIKLGEEYGELCAAIVRKDSEEIQDALGDMFVVMVAVAELEGLYLEDCVESAYAEIKDRKGYLNELGNFIKQDME